MVGSKLPEDVLRKIGDLADKEQVAVSRAAQNSMDGLGYTFDDVCDCLYEITSRNYVKTVQAHWDDSTPLYEFRVRHQLADQPTPDNLYVKVLVGETKLRVFSFKQQGAPQ